MWLVIHGSARMLAFCDPQASSWIINVRGKAIT